MSTRLISQVSLVGRQTELEAIEARLEGAVGGQGEVLLVAGEAGIGKTRLISEAASRARDAGWLVLSGQPSETDGAPPYLPFTEAFHGYAAGVPADELARLVGSHTTEVIRLLPELREHLPDVAAAPPVTPMSERFRFFEAVSDFVIALAKAQPKGLVLCLDDLHLADEATLLLLTHLARRLARASTLVIAAYRDEDVDPAQPLGKTLEALSRGRLARRMELRPLDLAATRELIAALAGSNPPAAVVRALHEESDGNPFYIEELFTSLAAEGRLLDATGRWRSDLRLGEAEVPRGVGLVVARRLDRLSPKCRLALTVAAVLGRRFEYALLREVSRLADEALLEALDEATQQGLVSEEAAGLSFSHELIRQTLLGDISLPRRQQLHLRAAEAIERRAHREREGRLAEIAGHYYLAGPFADPSTVVEHGARAGAQAAAAFAFEEALRLYDIALANAGAMNPTPELEETITGLHMNRAEALFSLGRWPDARPDLETALGRVSAPQRAEVLINLALACTWQPDMQSAKHYIAEAASLVEELDQSRLRAAVEAVLGYCDTDDRDLLAATSRFRKAASLAPEDQHGPYRRALWIFPLILHQLGNDGEAIERAHRAIEIARRVGDAAELANLLPTLGLALGGAGRYREAQRALAEGRKAAADYQGPVLAAISKSAGMHLDTFDLAGAKAFAEEAHNPASAVAHWPFPTVSSGIDLVLIAARGGEAGVAEELLPEIARQVAEAQGRHGWLWRMRLEQARAEVALVKSDWRQAVESGGEALRQSNAILRPKYQALALETRGKALIALGRKRDGLRELRQAVEIARPVGDPAMFLRAAAELLAFDGDDELVREAYEAAERIAADLPEEMLEAFSSAEPVRLVYKLRGSPFRRPRRPAGLSSRELEVLQLIAAGRSNQQIAETLVLSVRTVERHINHIYAKAGVGSRTQAMAFALREGIGQ